MPCVWSPSALRERRPPRTSRSALSAPSRAKLALGGDLRALLAPRRRGRARACRLEVNHELADLVLGLPGDPRLVDLRDLPDRPSNGLRPEGDRARKEPVLDARVERRLRQARQRSDLW